MFDLGPLPIPLITPLPIIPVERVVIDPLRPHRAWEQLCVIMRQMQRDHGIFGAAQRQINLYIKE